MINLNEIFESFISTKQPNVIERLTKKNEIKKELEERARIALSLKDIQRMPAWNMFFIPKLTQNLKSDMAKLMRQEALTMSESELKAIISSMRQTLSFIAEIKYAIEEGERAQKKIGDLK